METTKLRIDSPRAALNTAGMRIQAFLPYVLGIGLAVGAFALYFWLTSPTQDLDDGPVGPVGLPDVYNVL